MKRTDLANDAENAQLRSVVGSLSWVARQARPDLSYRVSKLQSVCGKASIKGLHHCNTVVKDAQYCTIILKTWTALQGRSHQMERLHFVHSQRCISITVKRIANCQRKTRTLQISKGENDTTSRQEIWHRNGYKILSDRMVINHQTCLQTDITSRIVPYDFRC